ARARRPPPASPSHAKEKAGHQPGLFEISAVLFRRAGRAAGKEGGQVRHVRLPGARGISAIAPAVATTLAAPAARAALARLAPGARLALGLLGLGVAIRLGGSGRRLGGFAFGLILLRLLLLRLMLRRRGEAGVDLDIVVEIVLRLGLPIRTRVHLLLG